LDSNDPEAAGFWLQQGVEKLIKAFLLSRGWQFKRIHHLPAFLAEAVTFDATLEEFRAICQRVTTYYLIDRYPLMAQTGITDEEVRTSHERLQGLIERLRTHMAR